MNNWKKKRINKQLSAVEKPLFIRNDDKASLNSFADSIYTHANTQPLPNCTLSLNFNAQLRAWPVQNGTEPIAENLIEHKQYVRESLILLRSHRENYHPHTVKDCMCSFFRSGTMKKRADSGYSGWKMGNH